MSILTIAQDAAIFCNMPRPSALLSASDDFEQEMALLLRQSGEEILRRHDWGRLIKTQAYTTNGTSVDFTVPSDFQRLVANAAVTYGTVNFIRGGLSDAEWRLQARQTDANHRYRMLGNSLQVVPAVSGANTPITMQYVSKYWLINAEGNPIGMPTLDTNESVLPDRLVTSCIVWLWKRLKKQSYQSELAEYEDNLAQEIAADRNFRVPTASSRQAVAKMEAKA